MKFNKLPFVEVTTGFFLLLIWWGGSSLSEFIPAPSGVLYEVYQLVQTDIFFKNLAITLLRILIGFTLAFVNAILCSWLIYRNKFCKKFFEVVVLIMLLIPSLVVSFILIVLFGSRELTPIIVVYFITLPQLIVVIKSGLERLNRNLFTVAKIYKLSKTSFFFDVVYPQLIPVLLAAIRVGVSMSWKVVIIAETFALNYGVGFQIYKSFRLFSLESVFAWTAIVMLIIGLFNYGLLKPFEEKYSKRTNF